jgi:hypothetical protein
MNPTLNRRFANRLHPTSASCACARASWPHVRGAWHFPIAIDDMDAR